MPKKTKKQKLRAEKRHVPVVLTSHAELKPSDTPTLPVFQFRSSGVKTKTQPNEDFQEIIAIKRDIVRTLLLAVVAMSIELVVYARYFRG